MLFNTANTNSTFPIVENDTINKTITETNIDKFWIVKFNNTSLIIKTIFILGSLCIYAYMCRNLENTPLYWALFGMIVIIVGIIKETNP